MAEQIAKPSRPRKYLRRALYAFGGFIGMAALGVIFLLVSLRFAKVRGYVVARVNSALSDSFKGRVTLHGLHSIGLTGIGAADAEVFDPAGRRVLDVHGLDVTLSLPTIAWAALTHGSKPLTIRLGVALRHAEVVLIDDGTGAPTLADTFQPKKPSPTSSGPGAIIAIDRIDITHAWAHGALASTPPLDVELKGTAGSLRSAPDETVVTVKRANIQARGLPQGADPIGAVQGSLNIPAAPKQPLAARAHYQGKAADIPIVLDASYVDDQIVAKLEASNVPPAAVAKQVPGLELRSPASLSASAAGKMPALHGAFALGVGSGKVDGDFDLLLKDDLSVKANVRARDLDAAELSRAAPSSNLGFTLHAAVAVPNAGPMTGHFELATEPSRVAAQSLPAVSVSGNFSNDAKTQRARVEAHAEVAEPGAQTAVDATVERAATHTIVDFRSATDLQNPARLKQLAHLRVRGNLYTQGSYQVEDRNLDAEIRADLRDLWQSPNHVNQARLRARVTGTLPHPNADVGLDVTDANISGQHIADAQLAARGSLSRCAVSAEIGMLIPRRHIQVSAIVSNDRGLSVDHPSINLSQGDTNLKISAKNVQVVDGRTTVDNLHLEGAGTVDASAVYGSGLESATVQTYQLDLARLWRLVDPKAPLRSGTATLGLHYEQQGPTPRAQLTLRGEKLAINRVSGGSLAADLNLENGRLDGTAQANLEQMGRMSFDFRELRGLDLARANPAKMSGKLAIEGQLDLRDLGQLIPPTSNLPVARARGVVKYEVSVERDQPGTGLPTFHAHVSTKDLQLAGARQSKTNLTTKQEALDAAPTAIKGLDFELDLNHEESGETTLAASVSDGTGPLAALSIEGKAAPRLATVAAELGRNWRQIPLRVELTIPPRQLEKLPVEVRPAGLSGVASGVFGYDGTLDAPVLKLSGKIDHFRQTEIRGTGLDLTWDAGYSGSRGTFKGSARTRQTEVGKADIDFETAISDWLNRGAGPVPSVTGNALLDFEGFPIALLPGTQTSQVDGSLTGKIELKNFGKDASLDSKLEARPFKVGQTQFARITTEVVAQGGKANASLRVDDRQGVTTADAHTGFAWGSKMMPSLVLPADAKLRAKGFRLAAVAPFLASSFGELDGRLNGDLNAHFKGGAPELDGQIDIDQGTAQIASLGQRFDQIAGHVTLVPGKVKLEKLTAHATSGQLDVTGEANFTGLDLTDADAHVRITRRDAIAVSVAGTEIGDCWGAIDLKMQPGSAERSAKLAVDIPQLHVHIPDTGSQDVQALDPAKDIRIGTQQRDRGDFVTLPLQPLTDSEPSKNERPMIVDLSLGKDIWIQRGDSTKVQLSGKTELILGDPATMTGQISLRGGKLDVSGKQFEIESGTVTFSGEPGNPVIVATARWDAKDDEQHRIYADYTGTVKSGKIVLRSEPPLTEDQVLSLLLTGSTDGSIGGQNGGGGGTAATAVGAVGGAATQGLNKALSNISALDVSTRVDTSTGSARPEVVVQISPKVSAALTRALGAPAPGEPPDLTFLTFDFRIRSRWSLSALVGDHGESGLDLIWRRRY